MNPNFQFNNDPIDFFMSESILIPDDVIPGPGTFTLTAGKENTVYLENMPTGSGGLGACYIKCVQDGIENFKLDDSSTYMFADRFEGGQLLAYGDSSHELTVEYSFFPGNPEFHVRRCQEIHRQNYSYVIMFRPGLEYIPNKGASLIGTYDKKNGWLFWFRKISKGKINRRNRPLVLMSLLGRRRDYKYNDRQKKKQIR